MSTLHTINGRPISLAPVSTERLDPTAAPSPTVKTVDPTVTTAAVATKQTHRPECGEVGVTGEHGDLGTNAK